MNSFSKRVRSLLLLLVGVTTILISLGSYVRTTGAGLSCPDWPLCFGEIVPDFSILGVKQEMIHRYIAKFAGLLCIAFVAIAWSKRSQFPKTFKFSVFLLAIVIIQGVFGGLTVKMHLDPVIVATHLALGSLFWQLCFVGLLDRQKKTDAPLAEEVVIEDTSVSKLRPEPIHSAPNSLVTLAGFTAWLTYLQIILGGYVGASGSSLACSDFPLCGGQLIPDLFTQGIQMLHRGLFVVLTISIIFLLVKTKRSGRKLGHLFGVVFMISLQLVIGVGNIHMKISPWMSIVHLLIAQMILLSLVVFWKGLKPDCRVMDIA